MNFSRRGMFKALFGGAVAAPLVVKAATAAPVVTAASPLPIVRETVDPTTTIPWLCVTTTVTYGYPRTFYVPARPY